MNLRERIPVCGMISTYNGDGAGVRSLFQLVYGRVRMEGFTVFDFDHLTEAFTAEMTPWLKDRRIRYRATIVDGFARASEALIGLFSGSNTGKMLVSGAD